MINKDEIKNTKAPCYSQQHNRPPACLLRRSRHYSRNNCNRRC